MSLFAKKNLPQNEELLKKDRELKERVEKNLTIHKMPKGLASSGFNYQDYFSGQSKEPKELIKKINQSAKVEPEKKLVKEKPELKIKRPASPHHSSGLAIMIVGALVVAALIYGAVAYLKNPDNFSFGNLFKKSKESAVVIVEEPKTEVPVEGSASNITTSTEVAATGTPIVEEEVKVIDRAPISDLDADGLSDQEEAALGTDPNNPNSDGDNYNDLTEVSGLYNPIGAGKIAAAAKIQKYEIVISKKITVSTYLPQAWKGVDKKNADGSFSGTFTLPDGSVMQVIGDLNIKGQRIKDWAQENLNLTVTDLINISGGEGFKSVDNSVYYFTNTAKTYIIMLVYTPAPDQPLYYQNIFDLMANSLTIK